MCIKWVLFDKCYVGDLGLNASIFFIESNPLVVHHWPYHQGLDDVGDYVCYQKNKKTQKKL
jgi:hypothetical protein